jgi:hypothetical protein
MSLPDDSQRRLFHSPDLPGNVKDPFQGSSAITHQGKVIGFAWTRSGRFYYNVLNIKDPNHTNDVTAWGDRAKSLPFPTEVRDTGADAVPPFKMAPCDGQGKSVAINDARKDAFRSTTACLTRPEAMFQVVEDGDFIYLFRTAIKRDSPLNSNFDSSEDECHASSTLKSNSHSVFVAYQQIK